MEEQTFIVYSEEVTVTRHEVKATSRDEAVSKILDGEGKRTEVMESGFVENSELWHVTDERGKFVPHVDKRA